MECTKRGAFKYLADKKMPVTIIINTVQPALYQIRPMPNVRTGVPAWLWLLFSLACTLLCLGAWTDDPEIQAMQWEPPTFQFSQAVCGHPCEMTLSRLNASSFNTPADPNAAVVQWVWNHPVEMESPDKELSPGRCNIIYGVRPSGIAFPGYISRCPKRISRRLYLQKKALLC